MFKEINNNYCVKCVFWTFLLHVLISFVSKYVCVWWSCWMCNRRIDGRLVSPLSIATSTNFSDNCPLNLHLLLSSKTSCNSTQNFSFLVNFLVKFNGGLIHCTLPVKIDEFLRFGRRLSLLISCVPVVVGWLITWQSLTLHHLYIARYLP